ncbi:MAG TPA: UdgX family uracil-DNA binding protein [Acidimicrobiales bacterium]|nr:UdgX family uracil-DNA binding protein [Acidimicrobiales bacterium]
MGDATRLEALAAEAAGCRDCPLWERATQTVFGDGSPDARLVLIGEQPGDVEDREGLPFVGPAGRLLDDALDAAEISRDDVWITNAVKHFKWKEKGKRRIHARPTRTEVVACRQWLDAELDALAPSGLVTLGATAGQALLGSGFRIRDAVDRVLTFEGRPLVATIHPSAVLRARDREERRDAFDRLVGDLRRAGALEG